MINVGRPGTWSNLSHPNVADGPPLYFHMSPTQLTAWTIGPLPWHGFPIKIDYKKSPKKFLLFPQTDFMQSSGSILS